MKVHLLVFILLAALTAVIYVRTIDYPFQFDDNHVVATNSEIRDASGLYSFFLKPAMEWEKKTEAGFYRPVLYSSYTLNYILFGPQPSSFRIFNIILHLFNSFLVFMLSMAILNRPGSNATWPWAIMPAVLFCVHPIQTGSVIFITARSVLLLTTFCLSSLWLYLRYRESGRGSMLAFSVFLYVLALLTKESAVPFFGVFLLSEYYFFKSKGDTFQWKAVLAFFLAAGAFASMRLYYLIVLSPTPKYIGWLTRWLTEISVIPRYMKLLILPVDLSVDHYVPRFTSFSDPYLFAGAAIILILFLLLARYLSTDPLLATLLAWPILVMLPEFVVPLNDPMVEYRLYLPFVGIVLFLTAVLFRGSDAKTIADAKPAAAVLISLVLVLGAASFGRAAVWATPISLWQDAVDKSPELARPYINLGVAFARQGSYAKAKRCLEEAVSLEPGENVEAYVNLGNVYAETGDLEKAAKMQSQALDIDPKNMSAYMNLALVYMNMKDFEAAYRTYLKMAEVFPDSREILLMGADNLKMNGQNELASRLMDIP